MFLSKIAAQDAMIITAGQSKLSVTSHLTTLRARELTFIVKCYIWGFYFQCNYRRRNSNGGNIYAILFQQAILFTLSNSYKMQVASHGPRLGWTSAQYWQLRRYTNSLMWSSSLLNNVWYLHSDRWNVHGRCRPFIIFTKNKGTKPFSFFNLQSFQFWTTRDLNACWVKWM